MELARVFLPDDSFETIAYSGKPVAHLLRENSFFIILPQNSLEMHLLDTIIM
jgi:hypothetical protein